MHSFFKLALYASLIFFVGNAKIMGQFQASSYEFGANIGTMVYQGDLTPGYKGNLTTLKPALGFSVSRLVSKHFSFSANLGFATVAEDESRYTDPQWRKHRAFNFSTSMTELSALAIWNFARTDGYRQPRFTPYVFAGGGLTILHTRKNWSRVNTEIYGEGSQVQTGLAVDTLQRASRVIGILPVGVGLRYRIGSQLSLNSSVNYRFTASDYIDGFRYSGNAGKKDAYYGIQIGILYAFGKYRCPPVQ